MKKVWGFRS